MTEIFTKHGEDILNQLPDIYESQYMSDLTIKCGNESFNAHKIILVMCSEYFAAMFRNPMKESNECTIELNGISPKAFRIILQFFYSGQIKVSSEDLFELLQAAHFLLLEYIIMYCCKRILSQLSNQNSLTAYFLAKYLSLSEMSEQVFDYIKDNFTEIVECEEFLNLGPDELEELLALDDIYVPSEDIVLRGLIKWTEFDIEKRKSLFDKNLSHIRLQYLSQSLQINSLCSENGISQLFTTELNKFHELVKMPLLSPCFWKKQRLSDKYIYYLSNGFIVQHDINSNNSITITMDMKKSECSQIGISGKKIYFIGDNVSIYDKNKVYDIETNTWCEFTNLNDCRFDFKIACYNNIIFAIGGNDGEEVCNLNRVDMINIYNNYSWTEFISLQESRNKPGVAVINDKLYIIGGQSADDRDGGYDHLSTIECYDFVSQQMSFCCPMNDIIGIGDVITVSDGYRYIYVATMLTRHFGRYDTEKDEWIRLKMLPEMHIFRAEDDGVVIKSNIYFIIKRKRVRENYLYYYSIKSDIWTKIYKLVGRNHLIKKL